jgi:hypothetical protein
MIQGNPGLRRHLRDKFSIAFYTPFLMLAAALLAGSLFGLFGFTIFLVVLWVIVLGLLVPLLPRY